MSRHFFILEHFFIQKDTVGVLSSTEKTTCVCSFWYIPGWKNARAKGIFNYTFVWLVLIYGYISLSVCFILGYNAVHFQMKLDLG